MGSSKLKRMIRTFVHSHFLRISHTFITKAKTLVIEAVKNINIILFIDHFSTKTKNKSTKQQILLQVSFRLHHSSHKFRLEQQVKGLNFSSDVSSLNTSSTTLFFSSDSFDVDDLIMAADDDDEDDERLFGYLDWLEGKKAKDFGNNIDTLADMFIAETHMKFKVEKEESYRKFQEMMARSV